MSQIDARDIKSPFSIRNLLNWGKLKENLKVYGRTGVVVYLGISFSVTASLYIALERNVDVKKLLGIKGEFLHEFLAFFLSCNLLSDAHHILIMLQTTLIRNHHGLRVF